MAIDNKTLGRFHLDGIPPAPRGTPQIEVSFDIDANGILNVSAKDKATGKEQSIRIEASSGLSDSEIEKMKTEAAEHAEEDKKKKDEVDTHNTAEQLIYQTEKQLEELKEKISDNEKKQIDEQVASLKTANTSSDVDNIKKETQKLNELWTKLSEKIYKETQNSSNEAAPETPNTNTSNDKPDVEDADFEVVDDK